MTGADQPPIEPADVLSEEGYYAVVPEWVLDADISAQAVRLYAVLRRYADQRTMFAHPSRRTLAGRLRVKDEKVVDRALADLQRIGAVTAIPRWRDEAGEIVYTPDEHHRERTSNGYRLHRAARQSRGGGGGAQAPTPQQASPHPGGAIAPGVGVEKGEKPQPLNYSQENHRGGTSGGDAYVSRGDDLEPPLESQQDIPVAAVAAAGPPPDRCTAHAPWPPGQPVPPCRACGDARRARAEWAHREDEQAREGAAAERERQLMASRLRDSAEEACRLCDDTGTAMVLGETMACQHDAARNERAKQAQKVARQAARDALRQRAS